MRYHGRVGKAEAIQLIATARIRGVGAMCTCGHLGSCENSCHVDTAEGPGMGECLVKDCLCQGFVFLRGLRKRRKGVAAAQAPGEAPAPAAPRRRGRPPKARPVEAAAVAPEGAPAQPEAPAPRRRGRPPKIRPEGEAPVQPRRRGRPPKKRPEGGAPLQPVQSEGAGEPGPGTPPQEQRTEGAQPPARAGAVAEVSAGEAAGGIVAPSEKKGTPEERAEAEPQRPSEEPAEGEEGKEEPSGQPARREEKKEESSGS